MQKEKRGESVHREDKTKKIKKEQMLEINTKLYFKNDMEGMKMRRKFQEGKTKWNPKASIEPSR